MDNIIIEDNVNINDIETMKYSNIIIINVWLMILLVMTNEDWYWIILLRSYYCIIIIIIEPLMRWRRWPMNHYY